MSVDLPWGPVSNATWQDIIDQVAEGDYAELCPAILLYGIAPEVTTEDVGEELLMLRDRLSCCRKPGAKLCPIHDVLNFLMTGAD